MALISFNHFPEIAAGLHSAIAAIVDETADAAVLNIQGHILANGQVDTGDMLNSVHKEAGESDTDMNIQIDAYYWIYQNYGTRFMAARPFLEPGMDDTRPILEAKMAALFSRIVV